MAESEPKFERNEMRAIIAFHWKKVLSPGECHKEIISVLGNGAVSLATVYNWFNELRHSRRSYEDDPRSGRPPEVTTDELKWHKVFHRWQERMERCIEAEGDYF